MKTRTRMFILFVLLLALALPTTAYARGLAEDKVVFGGNYTLASNQTLDGSLVVLGGNARLEPGSTVTRDVLLMGGNLEVNGHVSGNIASFGGIVSLTSTAVVDGDVSMLGSQLQRDKDAKVGGSVNTNASGPFSFDFSGWRGVYPGVSLPELAIHNNPVLSVMWYLLKAFFWAILAALVAMFVPRPLERTAETVIHQPVLAGGLGLLTTIVLPAVLILLAITICLSPVSLVGGILMALAWAFGLIAIGTEVGKRMAVIFKGEWALAVQAALGTFVLMLVVNGVGFIQCVGWVLGILVGMVGLGAVLLTRFGTQDYPTLYPTQGSPGMPSATPELPAQDSGSMAQPPEPPQV